MCSRAVAGTTSTVSCNASCSNVEFSGKAVIYSSKSQGCEYMAVNATIATTTSDDNTATSARTPKIVSYSDTDNPHSNTGD